MTWGAPLGDYQVITMSLIKHTECNVQLFIACEMRGKDVFFPSCPTMIHIQPCQIPSRNPRLVAIMIVFPHTRFQIGNGKNVDRKLMCCVEKSFRVLSVRERVIPLKWHAPHASLSISLSRGAVSSAEISVLLITRASRRTCW